MHRIARDRLLDLRKQDIVVAHDEVANSPALTGSRMKLRGRDPRGRAGNSTIARAMVERAPNPALASMTPARPIVAVSTVAPLCMTATNETMPLYGK
jgi:hypothetical protein